MAELEPASGATSTYFVLSVGGSYYLPYQIYATEEQFRRAYPRAAEFFSLKQQLDPTNKFSNELLRKYYHQGAAGVH